MKMNAGAWIGIIGGIIGFSVGLIAVLTTAGSSGIYIASGMIAVFGGMAFLFYKLIFQQIILTARLRKTGIDGTALIQDIHDTGVTINNSPQVKLLVEVKNELGQLYTTTVRTLVSRINPWMYSPGMTVPVKIDPRNEKNVIIDIEAMSQNSFPGQRPSPKPLQQAATTMNLQDITTLQSDVEKIKILENELLLTGKTARAVIKNSHWLGANVNGNNPFVELTMEILPDDAPAFEGKAKGVISAQAVNKFQPGCQIYVKYDGANKNKVVIHHS